MRELTDHEVSAVSGGEIVIRVGGGTVTLGGIYDTAYRAGRAIYDFFF